MEAKPDSASSLAAQLQRHVPALLALAAMWIGLRGLRKLAWTAFGLTCAWRWLA